MNKSILVIDTPKSCSECKLHTFQVCQLGLMNDKQLYVSGYTKQRHPQCPLQDTTELLEALEHIGTHTIKDVMYGKGYLKDTICYEESYNKLYKILGGNYE